MSSDTKLEVGVFKDGVFKIEQRADIDCKWLQEVIGGVVEGLDIKRGLRIYLHEEGILRELPDNEFGTAVLRLFGLPPHPITTIYQGPIVVLGQEDKGLTSTQSSDLFSMSHLLRRGFETVTVPEHVKLNPRILVHVSL